VNVRVTKRAQAQIDRAARWWDENRDLAPEAFDEDLAEAFLLLSAEPSVGAPVLRTRAQGVRRLHLARIRYHLYYRIRGDRVEVLALWHTSRGGGPSV
jgi:plasmid stabilization system protein ParE